MILTIFGYPKTGKTTLFNLLTGEHKETSKYSGSGDRYNQATVAVPDHRLKKVAETVSLPAVNTRIDYLDAGPISYGEVKNSTFLDLLRRADGLVHLVRGFEDPEIPHPAGSIDPVRDIREMEEELKTVDFLSVEGRLQRLEADLKKIKSDELIHEKDLLERLGQHLEKDAPLREMHLTEPELQQLRGFSFLSLKPILHIINSDEKAYASHREFETTEKDHRITLVFCAGIESELLELPPEERPLFQAEYNLEDYAYMRDRFVKSSYGLMDLISFFTIGKEDTRAWTIHSDTPAVTAAGKIHSDMEKGFIRAEVIAWDRFVEAGSFSAARERGWLRTEGRKYAVQDGEIIHFRFSG